jgi:hypothetical protein
MASQNKSMPIKKVSEDSGAATTVKFQQPDNKLSQIAEEDSPDRISKFIFSLKILTISM